jgi:hypothetical protein
MTIIIVQISNQFQIPRRRKVKKEDPFALLVFYIHCSRREPNLACIVNISEFKEQVTVNKLTRLMQPGQQTRSI